MTLWKSLTTNGQRVWVSLSLRFKWTGYKRTKEPGMIFKNFDPMLDPLMIGVSDDVMERLDDARTRSGVPFKITSGLRGALHNAELKGAVSDSAHLADATGVCHAVDLECNSDHDLFCMIFGLMMAGFRRMGIYVATCSDNPKKLIPRHIHVDDDTSKPLEVIWILLEQN